MKPGLLWEMNPRPLAPRAVIFTTQEKYEPTCLSCRQDFRIQQFKAVLSAPQLWCLCQSYGDFNDPKSQKPAAGRRRNVLTRSNVVPIELSRQQIDIVLQAVFSNTSSDRAAPAPVSRRRFCGLSSCRYGPDASNGEHTCTTEPCSSILVLSTLEGPAVSTPRVTVF